MYHIFDSVFCINLKHRKDRYKQSKQLFNRLNIPVEFYFVDKHPHSGRIGCFESHINVIKKSYHRGDEYVLIFEDDIIETPSFDESVMKDVSAYIKKSNCEYFQLGYSILDTEFISYFVSSQKGHIIDYNDMLCHSYILSRKGMKKVLEQYENFINDFHLDVFYKKILKGASVCPLLFQQNFCIKSDNSPPENNYLFFLRKLSCFQYKLSFFYILSLIKYYFFIFLILLILIFMLTIRIKKFKIA